MDDLNSDLLCIISKKIGDLSDFIRFRAVCKKWRLSVRTSDHSQQLPWLLNLERGPVLEHSEASSLCINFFSIYSNRTNTLHIPNAKDKKIQGPGGVPNSLLDLLGSRNGYLLMKDGFATSLLNPLTGCEIFKPRVSFLFVRLIAYYKERLFSSNRKKTLVHDVDGGKILSIPEPKHGFTHLIEAFGDLIGVREVSTKIGVPKFEVYRLDEGDTNTDKIQNPSWVKMTRGIGDRALFLDMYSGFCLKTCDFEGFKGNCIYFSILTEKNLCELARYDLESNEIKWLHFSTMDYWHCIWFLPSLGE